MAELTESTSETIDESAYITPAGVEMTVTLVAVLPIMCACPFLQRFFIKGVMIGAVKG